MEKNILFANNFPIPLLMNIRSCNQISDLMRENFDDVIGMQYGYYLKPEDDTHIYLEGSFEDSTTRCLNTLSTHMLEYKPFSKKDILSWIAYRYINPNKFTILLDRNIVSHLYSVLKRGHISKPEELESIVLLLFCSLSYMTLDFELALMEHAAYNTQKNNKTKGTYDKTREYSLNYAFWTSIDFEALNNHVLKYLNKLEKYVEPLCVKYKKLNHKKFNAIKLFEDIPYIDRYINALCKFEEIRLLNNGDHDLVWLEKCIAWSLELEYRQLDHIILMYLIETWQDNAEHNILKMKELYKDSKRNNKTVLYSNDIQKVFKNTAWDLKYIRHIIENTFWHKEVYLFKTFDLNLRKLYMTVINNYMNFIEYIDTSLNVFINRKIAPEEKMHAVKIMGHLKNTIMTTNIINKDSMIPYTNDKHVVTNKIIRTPNTLEAIKIRNKSQSHTNMNSSVLKLLNLEYTEYLNKSTTHS